MRFAGRVWRHIPKGGHVLDTGFILRAEGRWNRAGLYGCLYTAGTRETALAEFRKLLRNYGAAPAAFEERDLVSIDVELEPVLDLRSPAVRTGVGISLQAMRSDDSAGHEACRRVADWARQKDYVAILSPSAAFHAGFVLAIYPDMRPASNIQLSNGPDRVPINYGRHPLVE